VYGRWQDPHVGGDNKGDSVCRSDRLLRLVNNRVEESVLSITSCLS
jgi:hypothetical protein